MCASSNEVDVQIESLSNEIKDKISEFSIVVKEEKICKQKNIFQFSSLF